MTKTHQQKSLIKEQARPVGGQEKINYFFYELIRGI